MKIVPESDELLILFSPLNSIQKYIWESKEEIAAEYLASFGN